MDVKIFIAGDFVVFSEKEELIDEKMELKIREADFSICNFEAPIKSSGKPIPKAGPHLQQHSSAVDYVKSCGFTHCSLANNHIYDYGDEGFSKTISKFKKLGISTLGAGKTWAEANRLEIIEKNNISIGILAFCEAEFGIMVHENEYGVGAYINHYKTNQLIQNSKKQVDFLVVIIHAGVELINLPLPEWRYRYKELCDLGADAVLAHHPHVPQGWESYNGKPIFYSLGNFYFDKEGEMENQGLSVCLSFNENSTSSYEIIPHQKIDGVVCVSDDNQYIKWLDSLCAKLAENYFDEIESITMELYKERYNRHYQKSVKGYHNDMGIIKKIKRIISQIIRPKTSLRENNLLLLHNIRIESHRYVMQRALHILYEKNELHDE